MPDKPNEFDSLAKSFSCVNFPTFRLAAFWTCCVIKFRCLIQHFIRSEFRINRLQFIVISLFAQCESVPNRLQDFYFPLRAMHILSVSWNGKCDWRTYGLSYFVWIFNNRFAFRHCNHKQQFSLFVHNAQHILQRIWRNVISPWQIYSLKATSSHRNFIPKSAFWHLNEKKKFSAELMSLWPSEWEVTVRWIPSETLPNLYATNSLT